MESGLHVEVLTQKSTKEEIKRFEKMINQSHKFYHNVQSFFSKACKEVKEQAISWMNNYQKPIRK